ncbi:MAG: DUF4252 domain-containing protein [Ignavibacteriaceae bacterium]|jgi:hypothetical protein
MKNPVKIFLAVFLFAASVSLAQNDDDYSKYPGYFNFGTISRFIKGDNVTEVNIDYHLLNLISGLSQDNNDGLAQIIHNLKLVKVYSFEVKPEDQKELLGKIIEMDESLKDKKWDRIVKVKEPDQFTFVFIKPSGNDKTISGIVAVNYEKSGKATFVNIVGEINNKDIGKVANKFNVPSFEGKDNKKDK